MRDCEAQVIKRERSLIRCFVGASRQAIRAEYAKVGDMGDIAVSLRKAQRLLVKPKPLSIKDTYKTLLSIAEQEGKRIILHVCDSSLLNMQSEPCAVCFFFLSSFLSIFLSFLPPFLLSVFLSFFLCLFTFFL
jgi:hypothetical protein